SLSSVVTPQGREQGSCRQGTGVIRPRLPKISCANLSNNLLKIVPADADIPSASAIFAQSCS
ncbi:MAG: hypothetical protein ACRDA8_09010, partial [Shewanella sp.]